MVSPPDSYMPGSRGRYFLSCLHFLTLIYRENCWSGFLTAKKWPKKKYTSEEIKAEFSPRSRSVSPRKRQITFSEEGQFTTKRLCVGKNAQGAMGINQQDNILNTPLTYTSTSLLSVCLPESPTRSSFDRREWIRSRRPSDPSLYCCDYNKAEAEVRESIPGKPEWGGAYLCDQCLGAEYLEDRDKDVDVFS